MALKTALVLSGDASGAVSALQNTEQALESAAAEVAAFEKAHKAADAAIASLAKEQAQATQEIAKAKAAFKANEIGLEEYNRTILETKSAMQILRGDYRSAMGDLKTANDNLKASSQGLAPQMQAVTTATGAQRLGMQQLSYQLGDVATMYAMGARPQQIFASQAGQVIQAVQLMAGGTSKLATFLGGPWGIAVVAATTVLAPFISRLFDTADAANTARAALQGLIDKQLEEQKTKTNLVEAEQSLQSLYGQRKELLGRIATAEAIRDRSEVAAAARAQGIANLKSKLSRIDYDIATAEQAIAHERDRQAQDDQRNVTGMIEARARLAGATTALDRAQAQYTLSIKEAEQAWAKSNKTAEDQQRLLEARTKAERALNQAQDANRAASSNRAAERRIETLARESAAIDQLIDGLFATATAYRESTAAGMQARIEAEAMEKGILKQADLAAYVAQQKRKHTAEFVANQAEAIAGLEDQVRAQTFVNKAVREGVIQAEDASDALAKMAEQQKLVSIMALATANNDVRGYDEAAAALKRLTEAHVREIAARKEAADLARASQIDRDTDDIKLEARLTEQLGEARLKAMRSLSGAALDDEMARIAAEHQKMAITLKAEAEATRLLKLGMDDAAAAVLRQAEAEKNMVDLKYRLDADTKAVERLNEQLREMIGLLEQSGGIGGPLGALLGIATGNTSSVGGGIGKFLNLQIDATDLSKTVGSELTEAFKDISGQFGEQLTGALQAAGVGAQMGTMADGVLDAIGAKSSKIGAQIGGAIGNAVLGPIGGLIGSIAGGLLGGAFKVTKWGSATVTSSGITTAGNSNKREEAASDMGTNLLSSLGKIAEQLGGIVGDFGSISIGIRDKDYRVNTGGTSLKKSKGATDFNDDAQAAIAFALQTALDRGAVQGIRAGTQNLLKATDDLEKNLQNALRFEGVFADLQAITNPLSAAFATISKEGDSLRAIFETAGASAEEYAQLEQLVTEKRKAAIASLSEEFNDRFYSDAEKLAKAQAEVSAEMAKLGLSSVTTKDAFRAIVEGLDLNSESGVKMFEALMLIAPKFADVAEAASQAGGSLDTVSNALDAQRLQLQIRLLEAQGKAEEALVLTRQQERDGMDASLRAMLDQIYAAEDLAKANEAVTAAAEAQAAKQKQIADERAGLEQRLLQLQGDTNALRERELAALAPSNRALQEQVWAMQAAADAADAARQADEDLAKQRQTLADRLLELTSTEAEMRQRQLDAMAPSLRATQQQIWALEDAAKAADIAKQAEQSLANERAGLEQRLFDLTATAAEQRERELAALDPSNRAILERIYAIEDEKAATEAATAAAEVAAAAATKIADERAGLEQRLFDLTATTAQLRERELGALDPSNRAILERIYAIEDEKAATEAATAAAEVAAAAAAKIADERAGLEQRLFDLTATTAQLRERELGALDPSNRAILERIYAIEDEKAATEAATAAAEAAAAAAAKIADERAGLEQRLFEMTATTAQLRERELGALDPSNRAILERIYAIEDEKAATEAATAAAEVAAAAAAKIADERAGLEQRLFELTATTAQLRERELGALDPSNRAILERIYAIEDERAATEAATAAAEVAAAAAAKIADERAGLEQRLFDLTATAAEQRQRELAALDPSNRAILERIYAIEDEKAATEAATAAAEVAAAAAAKIADERAGLEQRLFDLTATTAQLRERELGALDPSNRAILERIYAIEDEKAATEAATAAAEVAAAAAAKIADERAGLEQRLFDLTATTAQLRERELGALDPSNRAILERIYAIEDEKAATEAATAAAEAAAAAAAKIADERAGLEQRLFEMTATTAQLRERELGALDPSNRAILERIYAIEDEKAATEAATAAAEAAAAVLTRIADERYGLETRLLELQGNTIALRQRELAQLDPTNRALQQQIWALEDAAAAAQLAADAQDAQTRAAEASAAALARIADERYALETRLLELQGNTIALRQRELAQLDPSNRALQQQVWAIEDGREAAQKQTSALREVASEFERTAATFGRLATDLRAYRQKLLAPEANTFAGYAAARGAFNQVAGLAAQGNETALSQLSGAGDAFLEAARSNARTAADYQRDVAMVARAVDGGIFAAESVADYAELQQQAAERQIDLLEAINQNTATMASSAPTSASAPTPAASLPSLPSGNSAELVTEVRAQRQESRAQLAQVIDLVGKLETLHRRWSGPNGTLRVSADDPLPVDTTP